MRIRGLLISALSGAMLLTLGLSIGIAGLGVESAQLAKAEQQQRQSAQQVSTLLVLAHEYARRREAHVAQQWRALHASFLKGLQSAPTTSRKSLESAARLDQIFGQLLEANAPSAQALLADDERILLQRQSSLLLDELLLNSQVLTDAVLLSSNEADQKRRQLEKSTRAMAIAIPILMLMMLAGLAVLLHRRVLRPLKQLEQTVSAISRGDLTSRSAIKTQDEFGDLSRHFDAMALDLVSELRREVATRKQAETELQLAASVFTHAREGIMITDPSGRILDVNATFTHITGYTRAEVLGRNPRLLGSGRHDRDFFAEFWSALVNQGGWSGEIWNRRKSGEIYAEMQTISAVRDEAGRIKQYLSLFSDITTLKEHEAQLESIAYHDALTGLPNRLLLNDRLQHAMLQCKRRQDMLALVYLDLDGFKSINDQHGHATGDKLLIGIAKHIKSVLRAGDTLARLGGDEFIILLVDLGKPRDCEPMLARILDAAALPVDCDGVHLRISASLGVAYYPQASPVDATQLLQEADGAMYSAKHEGKNRFRISGMGDLT